MTYHIHFYAPEEHLTLIKSAMFAAGAGRMGHYTHCAWQVQGQGQFRPEGDSEPYFGEKEHVAQLTEYKVDMICEDAVVGKVIAALKATHPYQEPAYAVFKMVEPSEIT